MNVLIAGSRTIFPSDKEITNLIVELEELTGKKITGIISGGAKGVDTCAEQYANKFGIKFTKIEPEWDKYGLKAGLIRNTEMLKLADALIAIWTGNVSNSTGTNDTIQKAKSMDMPMVISEMVGN